MWGRSTFRGGVTPATRNEILGTLRFLIDRADIPEAQELLKRMLSLEEGHTRQVGQQVNRIRDM